MVGLLMSREKSVMNELAVSIGVILFPGLIASVICDKIAAHSAKWDAFKYSIYSFIFGVTCYAVVQGVYGASEMVAHWISGRPIGPLPALHVWSIAKSQNLSIDLWEVDYATLAAPVVAGIATLINNNKLLNRFFRLIHVSHKYGDENLFSHYLNKRDVQWVYVRDPSTCQTYEGKILQWSETDHLQEIVLGDVTVYNYETCDRLYDLPSMYLAKPAGTFVIETIPFETKEVNDAKATDQRTSKQGIP